MNRTEKNNMIEGLNKTFTENQHLRKLAALNAASPMSRPTRYNPRADSIPDGVDREWSMGCKHYRQQNGMLLFDD